MNKKKAVIEPQKTSKNINSELLQKVQLINDYVSIVSSDSAKDITTNPKIQEEFREFANKRLNQLMQNNNDVELSQSEIVVLKTIVKKTLSFKPESKVDLTKIQTEQAETVNKIYQGSINGPVGMANLKVPEVVNVPSVFTPVITEQPQNSFVKEAEEQLAKSLDNNPEVLQQVITQDVSLARPLLNVVPEQSEAPVKRKHRVTIPAGYQPPTESESNSYAMRQAEITKQGLASGKANLGTIKS